MAILNITDEEYFKMEGINSTSFKCYLEDPIYYYQKYVAKTIPFKATEALTFGSALHCYVLQPELFDSRYMIKPDGISFTTKEGKAFKAEHVDKQFLSKEDMKLINGMSRRALEILPFDFAFGKHLKEVAMTSLSADDQWLKIKVDWLIEFEDKVYNIDLKTTTGLSNYKLTRTIEDYKYDVQGSLYSRVIEDNLKKPVTNFLLFVDKTTANARLININNFIEKIDNKVTNGLRNLKHSIDNNRWVSAYEDVTILEIPEWSK